MVGLKTVSSAMVCSVVFNLVVMTILFTVCIASTALSYQRMTEDAFERGAKTLPFSQHALDIFKGKETLFRLFDYPPVRGLSFSIPKLPRNHMLVNLFDECSIKLFGDWEYQSMSFRVRNFYQCDVGYFWNEFSKLSEGTFRDTKAGEMSRLSTSAEDVGKYVEMTHEQQLKREQQFIKEHRFMKEQLVNQEPDKTQIEHKTDQENNLEESILFKKLRACQYAENAQVCVGGPILVNMMSARVKEEFLPKISMLEGILKLEGKDKEFFKTTVSRKLHDTVKQLPTTSGRVDMKGEEVMKKQENDLVELKDAVKEIRGFLTEICKYLEKEGNCANRAEEMGFDTWPIVKGFFTVFVEGCRGIEEKSFAQESDKVYSK